MLYKLPQTNFMAVSPCPLPGVYLWSLGISIQAPPTLVCMETNISGWGHLLALIAVWNFLYFALCTPVGVLFSKAPKLPLSPPVRGFPSVQKRFLLHSSHLDSFVSLLWSPPTPPFFPYFFFFFLAFLEVWDLLPAFNRCSIGVIPHVEVFLMYLLHGS